MQTNGCEVTKSNIRSYVCLYRSYISSGSGLLLSDLDLFFALAKVILLYSEPLQQLPVFGSVWRAILEALGSAMANCASKSEILAEAIPEAFKNMLIVLTTRVKSRVKTMLKVFNLFLSSSYLCSQIHFHHIIISPHKSNFHHIIISHKSNFPIIL